MSHLPRLWVPGQVMHGVIRTVDQAFLLLPNPDVKRIVGSCVGRALQRHPVQLHACMAHINHIHFLLSVTDETLDNGTYFFQYLNGLLSREINKYWGRSGHVWANRIRLEPCADDQAAENMLVYVMSNPTKDNMVDHVYEWRGFSTFEQLSTEKPVSYSFINLRRWWKHGGPLSRKDKKDFEQRVTVQTTPLPHWQRWSRQQRQTRFATLIKDAEARHRENRVLEGKKALGMPAVLREHHLAKPAKAKKKTPKPLCHASNKGALQAFKDQWKEFLNAYRQASASYRQGIFDIEFPPGSYRPPLLAAFAPGA